MSATGWLIWLYVAAGVSVGPWYKNSDNPLGIELVRYVAIIALWPFVLVASACIRVGR